MATFVRTQEIEHEIGLAGTFSLRVTSGEVELRAIDGGTARVRASFELHATSEADADDLFDRVRLRVRQAEGLLELSEPKDQLGTGILARLLSLGTDVVDVHVEADIPRGAEVRFAGVSAEATASGLTGHQQYGTVSGDLVVTDAGGDLRIQAVSGDVSVRAERQVDLNADSVSGDLSAIAPRYGQVRVNTVSGDVWLEGALVTGPGHRVETVSGDLSIGLVGGLALEVRGLSTDVDCTLPHRTEGSRDRRRYIVGDGKAGLSFSSMSGDVSIQAARRVASVRETPALEASESRRAATSPDEQLEILRALERGELTVDEAAQRLGGD